MGVESFALRYQDYRQKGTTLFRCRLPVEGIDAAALETNAHRVHGFVIVACTGVKNACRKN